MPLTTEQVDAVTQRVGIVTFMYYPEIHVAQPDYSLDEEVAFCLEPATDLTEAEYEELRIALGRAIIDPSMYRTQAWVVLLALSDEQV